MLLDADAEVIHGVGRDVGHIVQAPEVPRVEPAGIPEAAEEGDLVGPVGAIAQPAELEPVDLLGADEPLPLEVLGWRGEQAGEVVEVDGVPGAPESDGHPFHPFIGGPGAGLPVPAMPPVARPRSGCARNSTARSFQGLTGPEMRTCHPEADPGPFPPDIDLINIYKPIPARAH